MMNKEEIENMFQGMEYFVDDDYGGSYNSVVGNQDANSMLGYLMIRDYILNLQNQVEQLEADLHEANNTINQYKEREQNIVKYLEQEKNVNRVQYTTLNGNIKSEMIKSKYVDRKLYAREILGIFEGEERNEC